MSITIKQTLKNSIADWVRQRYTGATVEIPIEVEDFKITEFISCNNVIIPSEGEYDDLDLVSSTPKTLTVVDTEVQMKHNDVLFGNQKNYFKLSYYQILVEYDNKEKCFHIKGFHTEGIKKK